MAGNVRLSTLGYCVHLHVTGRWVCRGDKDCDVQDTTLYLTKVSPSNEKLGTLCTVCPKNECFAWRICLCTWKEAKNESRVYRIINSFPVACVLCVWFDYYGPLRLFSCVSAASRFMEAFYQQSHDLWHLDCRQERRIYMLVEGREGRWWPWGVMDWKGGREEKTHRRRVEKERGGRNGRGGVSAKNRWEKKGRREVREQKWHQRILLYDDSLFLLCSYSSMLYILWGHENYVIFTPRKPFVRSERTGWEIIQLFHCLFQHPLLAPSSVLLS